MGPGSKISFSRVTVEEANDIYKKSEARIDQILEHVENNSFNIREGRSMKLKVNGKSYSVEVNEIV
jgi:allophanate hydrolase subunit 2